MDQATTSFTCTAEVPGSNLEGTPTVLKFVVVFFIPFRQIPVFCFTLNQDASFHIPSSSLFSYQRYIIATDKAVR